MSEYNYITEQHFWKRTRPRSCWCPVSFPLKPFVCSLKAETPNPSSPSPCICQSTAVALIWEMYAQLCPPHQEWETRAGRRGVVAWACLSNVAHPTIKVREQSLLLLAFSGNSSKTSFQLPPYPPASFRLAPRPGEWFFLKAIMRNSSSHSKSVLL